MAYCALIFRTFRCTFCFSVYCNRLISPSVAQYVAASATSSFLPSRKWRIIFELFFSLNLCFTPQNIKSLILHPSKQWLIKRIICLTAFASVSLFSESAQIFNNKSQTVMFHEAFCIHEFFFSKKACNLNSFKLID